MHTVKHLHGCPVSTERVIRVRVSGGERPIDNHLTSQIGTGAGRVKVAEHEVIDLLALALVQTNQSTCLSFETVPGDAHPALNVVTVADMEAVPIDDDIHAE